MTLERLEDGFGLYVHWPFCRSKCPYCDFNSHVRASVDERRFTDGLILEMETLAAKGALTGRRLDSIFFGGGTPSLMPARETQRLIAATGRLFPHAETIEITLEANPTHIEAEHFLAFADAGINRLSIGVQSLDDTALGFLGRQHSAAEALMALAHGRRAFSRVSADFIYARPGQSTNAWRDELNRILDLDLDHLSLYQLTLEPGTVFYRMASAGKLSMMDEAAALEQFLLTKTMTEAAGLAAYEISNYAREGEESRHNLIYWQGGDWLGVGPGAHGRFWQGKARIGYQLRRSPDRWLREVGQTGHGIEVWQQEAAVDYAAEALMMGLRLKQGVRLDAIEAKAGSRTRWLDRNGFKRMLARHLVTEEDDRLRLTDKGRPLADSVIAALLA